MKRNLLSRTSNSSRFLFGTIVGLVTLTSSTYAQTSDGPQSVAWPNEFRLRARTPNSMALPEIENYPIDNRELKCQQFIDCSGT